MSNIATRQTAGSVVAVDLDNLNIDAAMGALDRAAAKAGMNGGGNRKRLFPGTSYFFKKGWRFGQGKDAPKIEPPRLVVNVAHLGMVYMKFATNDAGKTFPQFSELCIPMLDQDLVDRDSLGDTDPDDWETDDKGKPMDPWTLQIAIPARTEDDNAYHHVLATGKTNHNTLHALFREALAEMKLKPGRLPVVQFATTEFSKDFKEKNKAGKLVPKRFEWEGMGYEIVGWVKATELDRLNQNVDMGEDDPNADVDLPKATVKQRGTAQKALPAPTKPEPKKAEPKIKGKLKKAPPEDM